MTKLSFLFLVTLMNEKLRPKDPTPTPKLKHHWSYEGKDGPDFWPNHYEICGRSRQSPINIVESQVVHDTSLAKFELFNFDIYSKLTGTTILNITNNGHSASCALKGDFYVDGGGLIGHYRTAEFHFHWGGANNRGSEHALTGRKYPLEMHIVNYAEKYGNLSTAMKEPDGLAVLGVMFELSPHDNPALQPIMSALRNIVHDGNYEVIDNCSVRALLPNDLGSFYRYEGSLTTPPCYESVIWTVFAETQTISEKQLQALRSLEEHQHSTHDAHGHKPKGKKYMVDNFRPLQPLYNRKVAKSFPGRFVKNGPTRFSAPPSGQLSFVQPGSNGGQQAPSGSFKNHDAILEAVRDAQKQPIISGASTNPGVNFQPKGSFPHPQQAVGGQNPDGGGFQYLVTTQKPYVYPQVTLIRPEFLPQLRGESNFGPVPSPQLSSLTQPEVPPPRTIITSGALEKPSPAIQQSLGSQKNQVPNVPRVVSIPSTTGRPPVRQNWSRQPNYANHRQSLTSTHQPSYNQWVPTYNYGYAQPVQAAPPVYLQSAPQPVRVRKPYYYNYYMNGNAPAVPAYGYPTSNYGAMNYGIGELVRRKRRSDHHKSTSHHKTHHKHHEDCKH